MIRRLHDRLGISAEVLIRPSRKEKAGVIVAKRGLTATAFTTELLRVLVRA